MKPTRREFLRGLLTVTAVAIAPAIPALASVPVLYGDGLHDDTAALNALFSGKPVTIEGEHITTTQSWLSGGQFRISDTVFIKRGHHVAHCDFDFRGGSGADTAIEIDGGDSEDSLTTEMYACRVEIPYGSKYAISVKGHGPMVFENIHILHRAAETDAEREHYWNSITRGAAFSLTYPEAA